jgi:periplasmic divalent cation tolerance protein
LLIEKEGFLMENAYMLVMITAPSLEVSEQIANALVEAQLAACVNITAPITSIYRWQGKVEREQEYLLLCKTRRELFNPQFTALVQEIHPYDVPEMIALPIQAGVQNYLDWISAETKSHE